MVKTDLNALTWLHKFKVTKAKHWSWALLLQEINFDIEYCPDTQKELPDLLSRKPEEYIEIK